MTTPDENPRDLTPEGKAPEVEISKMDPPTLVAHGRDLAHRTRRAVFLTMDGDRRKFSTEFPGYPAPSPYLMFDLSGLVLYCETGRNFSYRIAGHMLDEFVSDNF